MVMEWNIGIVVKPLQGRDGVVRAVRAGRSYLERTVLHIFTMELPCDQGQQERVDVQLTLRVKVFRTQEDMQR